MGPLHGVTSLREKHRYNITPWARKLSDDDDSETEEDERLAVAAAMFSMAQRIKKGDCNVNELYINAPILKTILKNKREHTHCTF